jgi:hypothetical protein
MTITFRKALLFDKLRVTELFLLPYLNYFRNFYTFSKKVGVVVCGVKRSLFCENDLQQFIKWYA